MDALFFFLGLLFGRRLLGWDGPQPIPPHKQPKRGRSPRQEPQKPEEPIVPPPNKPGYEPNIPPPKEEPPEPPKAKPDPVPPSYKPSGWVPYSPPTSWVVTRAKWYLARPSLLPVGSSITETDPKGILVKFRAESGKQHGDPNLKRAVTAWRKAA